MKKPSSPKAFSLSQAEKTLTVAHLTRDQIFIALYKESCNNAHMSELLPEPYAPLFREIEVRPQIDTVEAYNMYASYVDERSFDPCIYLSMAITSGGFARDTNLDFGTALQANTEFGQEVGDAIAREYDQFDISRSDIVVPASLGKVEGWGQADYLLFWAHVITGLSVDQAAQIDLHVRSTSAQKLPGFHDKSLPKDQRWNDYKALMDEYVWAVDALPTPFHAKNMQAMILILDPEESLGVNGERYLCHRLGFGEYSVLISESEAPKDSLLKAKKIGAKTLEVGFPHSFGHHNIDVQLKRRAMGQMWRKSGIVSGIIDRRLGEVSETYVTTASIRTKEELWREYYEA